MSRLSRSNPWAELQGVAVESAERSPEVASREESRVERLFLRGLTAHAPRVLVFANEVGQGYPVGQLRAALERALAADPRALATVREVLKSTPRVAYGLGVGSPDTLLIDDGRAGFIEWKSARGVLSDEQRLWHAAARNKGVFVAVCRTPEEGYVAIERMRRGALE